MLRRIGSSGRSPHDQFSATQLTAREREILGLIDDGLSNKEIAGRLCIELSTVKNHVHNILAKLKARHRWQAVMVARDQGIIL